MSEYNITLCNGILDVGGYATGVTRNGLFCGYWSMREIATYLHTHSYDMPDELFTFLPVKQKGCHLHARACRSLAHMASLFASQDEKNWYLKILSK